MGQVSIGLFFELLILIVLAMVLLQMVLENVIDHYIKVNKLVDGGVIHVHKDKDN